MSYLKIDSEIVFVIFLSGSLIHQRDRILQLLGNNLKNKSLTTKLKVVAFLKNLTFSSC